VMIEILIDPVSDGLFDVAEVGQHSPMVKIWPFDRDDRPTVVPVQKSALPIIVDEAMAIAE